MKWHLSNAGTRASAMVALKGWRDDCRADNTLVHRHHRQCEFI